MDEVAKYNTCKKLVQLNKVVEYLKANMAEREYQRQCEKQLFLDKEENIVTKYHQKCSSIKENMNKDTSNCIQEVNKLYSGKLEVIKSAFQEKTLLYKQEIDEVYERVTRAVIDIANEIYQLNNELESQIAFLNNPLKSDQNLLKEKRKQLEFRFNKQISEFDLESHEKIQKLENETENKLNKLLEDQKIEKILIAEEYSYEKIVNTPATMKLIKTYKKIAVDYSDFIESVKPAIKNVYSQYIEFIESTRNKLEEQLKVYGEIHLKFRQENNEINREIKEVNKNHIQEVLDLKRSSMESVARQTNEKTLLKNEIKILEESFLSEQKRKIAMGTTNSRNATTELNVFNIMLKDEMNNSETIQKAEENSINATIKKLEDRIKLCDTGDDEISLSAILNDRDHELAINRVDIEHENKSFLEGQEELKNKFGSKIKIVTDEIEKRKKFLSKVKQVDDKRRNLNATLQSILTVQKTALLKIQEAEEFEINQSKLQREKEEAKLNEAFEKKFALKKKTYDQQLEEEEKKYEEVNNQMINKNNEIVSKALEEERNNFDYDCEKEMIEKVNKEYSAKLMELEKVFKDECMGNPDLENTKNEYSSYEGYLEELKNNIEAARKALIRQNQIRIEEEIDRHRIRLISYISSCDQFLSQNRIDEELAALRKSKMDMFNNLEYSILSLTNTLQSVRAAFSASGALAVDCEEVRELQQELEKLRYESDQNIKAARAESLLAQTNAKNSIETWKRKNSEEKKSEQERMDRELESIKATIENETKRRGEFRNLVDSKISKCSELFKETVEAGNRRIKEERDYISGEKRRYIEEEKKHKEEDAKELEKQKEYLKEREKKSENAFKEELLQLRRKIPNKFPELDGDIARAIEKRNEARDLVEKKPVNEEEESIVRNLKKLLRERTHYLTLIGKDLLMYRERMLEQETVVNARFGGDKQVGVISSRSPMKIQPTKSSLSQGFSTLSPTRPQTAKAGKLPRLGGSFAKTL